MKAALKFLRENLQAENFLSILFRKFISVPFCKTVLSQGQKRSFLEQIKATTRLKAREIRITIRKPSWLPENGIPFSIVFTKADKSKPTKLKANIDIYLKTLKEQWEELPPYFITSSENKTGRTELLNYIESINKSL